MKTDDALNPGWIDIWCVFVDDIRDHRLIGEYRHLLAEDERRREQTFCFAADRVRYVVTRALTRSTLSRYVGVAPEHWTFTTNPYGRPEILNDGLARSLSFNISHTKSLIVLAVSRDRRLGVDVEHVSGRQAALDVANHFFSSDEIAALNALPATMRHQRFWDYWTLKESYIKARGLGLSIPLDQFSFDAHDGQRLSLSISDQLDDDASRWRFWQFWPSADHLGAVCAERDGAADSVALRFRSVVPLVSEASLPCSIARDLACTPV